MNAGMSLMAPASVASTSSLSPCCMPAKHCLTFNSGNGQRKPLASKCCFGGALQLNYKPQMSIAIGFVIIVS